MRNIRLDTYDTVILMEIHNYPRKSIRDIADRLSPGLKKTQVGERIKDMVELGLLATKGATKGAKRSLTDKGEEWLRANGHLD